MTKKFLLFSRTQNYWHRQGFFKYVFVLFLLGFGFRIVTIHAQSAGDISLQQRGIEQTKFEQKQIARRGDIVDRNNKILASSLLYKKVQLDPSMINDEFIPPLAMALEMPEKKLREIIEEKRAINSRYLIIKKDLELTNPILAKIKSFKNQKYKICKTLKQLQKPTLWESGMRLLGISEDKNNYLMVEKCKKRTVGQGVVLRDDERRYYPKSASMGPLIGLIDANNRGISGIENEFDHVLSGQDGIVSYQYDGNENNVFFNPETTQKLKHGENIKLTIDTDIQFHVYQAIKHSVEKHEANSGSAIVLAPNGEVLAMANYPADDPNNKSQYNPEHWRNRVLQDKVEPGSTMKPFTILIGLDQNNISGEDNELINVSKSIGHIKSDEKARKYGDAINVKLILQKSHNLGTVNISERLTKEQMYDTWRKLGFGQPLGLLPSTESSGSLKHPDDWSKADKRALSFGHGPMETNLAQLAKAYLIFANDGATLPLKLVENSAVIGEKTQVFSPQATHKMADLLDAVVSWKGSGYRARIKGYEVAGKTGTAEMVVDGSYSKKGAKRTFFTGFVPVKQPKYIMAVRLDHPKKCYTYWDPSKRNRCEGSNSAAMTFQSAMNDILNNDSSLKLVANK